MTPDSHGLQPAPANLDLLITTRTNMKLVAQLAPEALASARAAQEPLARVTQCVQDIHARLHELHTTTRTLEFPLPTHPEDTMHDRHAAAVKRKFSPIHAAKTSKQVFAAMERESPVAHDAPTIPSLIAERGSPEDVVAYERVEKEFSLAEKMYDLVAPSWTSWIDRFILWERGFSLTALREETRGKLQACAARTEELYLLLLEKPAPAILHTQQAFWRKAKGLFEKILVELHTLQEYLEDPSTDGRNGLAEELDRIQLECAKADRRAAMMQDRIRELEAAIAEEEAAIKERQQLRNGDRKKKKMNGERLLSKHAGTVQIEEKRRQLADTRLQKESVDQRQRQLDGDIQRYRARLDTFDPLAVNIARIEQATSAISKHVERFIAEQGSTDDKHRSFGRVWHAANVETMDEAAIQAAEVALRQMRAWAIQMMEKKANSVDEAVRRINGNWQRINEAYNSALEERSSEFISMEKSWAQQLANYLSSFDDSLRHRIAKKIWLAIPGMDLPLPQPRMYGQKFVKAKETSVDAKHMMQHLVETAVAQQAA